MARPDEVKTDVWGNRRAQWTLMDSIEEVGVTPDFVQTNVTGRLQQLSEQVAKMAAVSGNPKYLGVVELIKHTRDDISRMIQSGPGVASETSLSKAPEEINEEEKASSGRSFGARS